MIVEYIIEYIYINVVGKTFSHNRDGENNHFPYVNNTRIRSMKENAPTFFFIHTYNIPTYLYC